MHGQSFTKYGWSVCIWVLVVSFQYGYHTSVLNQIQAVITCKHVIPKAYLYGLPTCIPMSDLTFSFITAVFTVGGLSGSLCANLVMDKWGRKGATKASGVLIGMGSLMMAISSSVGILGLGRFFAGLGSGIGLCVGPIYLSEIAPTRISGSVGVLTQLAIVLGIMTTQSLGLQFSTPAQWRFVFFLSCALSVIHFVTSAAIVESPAWLRGKGPGPGAAEERVKVAKQLWGEATASLDSEDVEADPLLFDEAEVRREEAHGLPSISVPELFKSRDLRKPLLIVSLAMVSQQLSGINAVLYYSNDILSKSLPDFAPYVSLGITIVNVLMTFPPIILIERMGRRQLLTISTLGALGSLFLVGLGLDTGFVTISSVAIMTFVTSFAVGLGPIPFVMIPEVSPYHAVSALSSVALSLNWIANFTVGLIFLPLRNFLAHGDVQKEGRVFYVFATVLFLTTLGLSRVYKG